MGVCKTSRPIIQISDSLRDKAEQTFQKIDLKSKGVIDKETTREFWKSNFAKINTEALFKSVDFNNDGSITLQEWLAFWDIVKKSGYSEDEISNELTELQQGKAWVLFKNADMFIQDDKRRKSTKISSIVQLEIKKSLRKSKTIDV